MKKNIKVYYTLQNASTKYNIEIEKLQEMIETNSVRIVMCDKELAILEDDIRRYLAAQITLEQFQHLNGNPIMLSEAAKKYDLNSGSLWRWIGQGHIGVISRDGYRVFVNEADVAYIKAIRDVKKTRSGQSLFER